MNEFLIGSFLLAGSVFIFISAIGMVRFNDVFSRLHASTKATSFGLLLIIIGVVLFFATGVVITKGILVVLFIYLTAPLAAHAIAISYKDDIN